MTYIKKMVMHGFKSFARKTDIPLENAMNVIVGPNGSGKSNITDALCFVLGRLSIKSIRAAKAANLLFSGNKMYKGASEAYVELVFDNVEKTFALDEKEVTIRRTVRKNGQSIYRINGVTKTRNELLELLSQAGIDPNGFNIVLQGEIGSLVKATAEERRKILEEVAGISVYETRKHKSLKELERSEDKLKEVSAVLKARNAQLKSLERERAEALNHKKLEETIARCKKTLLERSADEKVGEVKVTQQKMVEHQKEISSIKQAIMKKEIEVASLQKEIELVSKKIDSSSEQEALHREMTQLNVDIASLKVRQENFDKRIVTNQDKIIDMKERKEALEEELNTMRSASPEIKKQQEQQKGLQEKLDDLEKKRRRFYHLRSEISTKEHARNERERLLIESRKELELIEQNINVLVAEIKYAHSLDRVRQLKAKTQEDLQSHKRKIEELEESILAAEKQAAIHEANIVREQQMKDDIVRLKVCSICKQEVEEGHKHKISAESEEKVTHAKRKLKESAEVQEQNRIKIMQLKDDLEKLATKLNELDIDEIKVRSAEERKERIKKITQDQEDAKKAVVKLNEELHGLRKEFDKLKDVEEHYDETRMNLQDVSFADLDVDSEIALKQRDMNRFDKEIKAATRDVEESEIELNKVNVLIVDKQKTLRRKEEEAQVLYEKNRKFIEEKTELQDRQKAVEVDIFGDKNMITSFEERINHNRILEAQLTAQLEALREEIVEFGDVELFTDSVDKIKERLQKAQFRISRIGSVNMLALETFDTVADQVKLIEEKVATLEIEKEKVRGIIAEIDKKKKKAFLTTLNAVNEYFTRNFSQLSKKGQVFLELEDKKDPFNGGLNILIKVSRGRYFDIASLSGGEKTLVALSLIFAIQEYRPYRFYIFDEIDAALDKHNSELLAALIKKYMKTGQYIIITHNDTLITEATNLYGVSMQENISKIISLKV